jgi:hypothetical protein
VILVSDFVYNLSLSFVTLSFFCVAFIVLTVDYDSVAIKIKIVL